MEKQIVEKKKDFISIRNFYVKRDINNDLHLCYRSFYKKISIPYTSSTKNYFYSVYKDIFSDSFVFDSERLDAIDFSLKNYLKDNNIVLDKEYYKYEELGDMWKAIHNKKT